jgi:hypothetical protein
MIKINSSCLCLLFHFYTELKNFKLESASIAEAAASDAPAPNAELLSILPEDHPLTAEIRSSEINFDELLKTKINTKGTTLQDQKKRLDDQKNLILKLRDGMSWLRIFHLHGCFNLLSHVQGYSFQ